MLRVALLFANLVLGVQSAPLDEPRLRRNDTTNTTSSSTEEEGWMTIFAPIEEKTALSLDVPSALTTYTAVTQLTQLSLEGPTAQETESPSRDDTSHITVAPSAHIEHSASYIVVPGTDTEDGSRAPKMPHVEKSRTELDGLPGTTDPATSPDQDGGDSETAGPSNPPTEVTGIAIVVPVETGKTDSGSPSGSQDQHSRDGQPNANPTGNADGHAPRTFLLGTTPIIAGGSPVTLDGNTYSLAPTGSAVVVNGATILFTTDEDGQARPLGTATEGSDVLPTDSAASQVLGGLSVAPEEVTSSGENAQETQSGRSPTTTSGNDDSRETSADSKDSDDNNTDDSEATSTGSSPAMQTDNAGVTKTLPLAAIVGAIGFLVAVM